MKPSQLLKLLLAAGTISNFFPSSSVLASSFGETEVNHRQFAVVAAPYRHGYNLLILEQMPGQRPCWSETGSNPTVIEPLFLEFDFTNACVRSADSNSYSIRFEGEDYGLDYLLNVVEREGELHLVGTPRDSSKPELHIGKTNGLSSGSLKIQLNSEWHLTKRTYQGNPTEHVYLSNTSDLEEQLVSQSVSSNEASNHEANNQQSTKPLNNDRQPAGTVYQQPVTYPVQQPVGTVYQQPVTYPVQQPVGTVYQQPVTYPEIPLNINYQQNK
ncbi:exported hypothetical protein [Hyella patelloides LEGE 07179]|uniref:DUF3747 domain-containing protein n=1 Tax=Hyella patelloides LEGE 07179 TaxID=945734 RepID=A0A563VVP5_9CYAN|nr:DUF3747 domain-containing protein [Hyella patelloides]VEP15475.1 exported hypothetical protein [Hyella patelloides LEGE 07179]